MDELLEQKELLETKCFDIDKKLGLLLEQQENYDQILSQLKFYFERLENYDSFLEKSKKTLNTFLIISIIGTTLLHIKTPEEFAPHIEKISVLLFSALGIMTLNALTIRKYFLNIFNKMNTVEDLEIKYYDIVERLKGTNNAFKYLSNELLMLEQQLNETCKEINKLDNPEKNKVFTKNIST